MEKRISVGLIMLNELKEEIENIDSSLVALRNFGLTIGGIFLVIGLLFWWKKTDVYFYLILSGIILVLAGFVSPRNLKPIQKIWMGFALILGFIMTRLILGIFFYAILTPFGFLIRSTGRSTFSRDWKNSKSSYWNLRKKEKIEPTSYEKQF